MTKTLDLRGQVRRVTSIVPCYNLAKYIGECVEGLVHQVTQYEHEILVCDDASTDESVAILKRLASHFNNVRLLKNPNNVGLVCTMRRLLDEASGDCIAYMDGDDVALPGKIQALAGHLDRYFNCAIAYHDVEIFHSDTGLTTGLYSSNFYNAEHIPDSASVDHLLIHGVFLQASSVMFRAHGEFERILDHGCKIICDYPLHLGNALVIGGSIDKVPGVFGRYRIHNSSFGAQTRKSVERRQAVTRDLILAATHARALGASADSVTKSYLHSFFSAALYFLRAGEDGLFIQNLKHSLRLSSQLDWSPDERLEILRAHQDDPDYLRTCDLWR